MRKKYLVLDRLLALIYDLIFLGLTLLIIVLGFNYLNTRFFELGKTMKYMILVIISGLVYLFEFTILPLLLKGTIGKFLLELEVVSTKGKITFGRMLFREIVLKHILYLSIIGFIIDSIFYIIKKQTIHDYLLKTSVSYKDF